MGLNEFLFGGTPDPKNRQWVRPAKPKSKSISSRPAKTAFTGSTIHESRYVEQEPRYSESRQHTDPRPSIANEQVRGASRNPHPQGRRAEAVPRFSEALEDDHRRQADHGNPRGDFRIHPQGTSRTSHISNRRADAKPRFSERGQYDDRPQAYHASHHGDSRSMRPDPRLGGGERRHGGEGMSRQRTMRDPRRG